MAKDKLEIEITADDKASGVLKGIGGALGGLGGIAGKALLGVAGLAVTGLGGLVASAVATNATLETSTLQFETLLGSADAAKDHIAGLYEFGAKTPFETEPIIEASKNLLTFGGTALDTEENLLRVGNAAAVTGGSIDDVAFWFGRAYGNIQAGKPFGEAAARLQEMGILTGDTRIQLEEMSKAGADSTEIWNTLTGEFDRFDGAMEKQAATWEGLVSTITDNLQLAVGEALKPFFEAMKDVVGVIAEFVQTDEFMAAIAQIGAQLAPLAENFGEIAIELMTNVGPALFDGVIMPLIELAATAGPPVIELLGVLLEAFSGISQVLVGELSTALTELVSTILPPLQTMLPGLSMIIKSMAEAFGLVLGALIELLPSFMTLATAILEPLADVFDDVVTAAEPLIDDIITALIPIIKDLAGVMVSLLDAVLPVLAEAFLNILAAIAPLIATVLPPLVKLFGDVMTALMPIISEIFPVLVNLVLEIVEAFAPLVAELLPPLANLFLALIEAIVPLIVAVLPILTTLITEYIDTIIPLIEIWMPVWVEWLNKLAAWIRDVVVPAIGEFANWVKDHLIPEIKKIAEWIREHIIPAMTEFVGWIKDKVLPAIGDFAKWIKDEALPAIDKLVEWIKEHIIPAFEKFVGWIREDIVPAINDIRDAIGDVCGWIDDMVTKLGSIALPDFLTPGSPTPFEVGIRGISDAMGELVTDKLPGFNYQLGDITGDSLSFAGASTPGHSAPVQLIVNYNPMISLADQDEVVNRIRPLMFQIIREYNRKGGRA